MSTDRHVPQQGDAPTGCIVTQALLLVPADMVVPMLQELSQALGARGAAAVVSRSPSSPTDDLLALLGQEGWQTERYPDGRVRINGRSVPLQDIGRDPVLESALGRVPPGCFVQLYSAGNRQWEIRFYEASRVLVEGKAAFPQDSEWGRIFRSLLVLREAEPRDAGQLAALSPVPVRFEEGPLLLAERGDRVVSFLQYRPGEEQGACTITRLVTLPQGGVNGYPQALVDEVRRRYRQITVSRLVSSDHKRLWKRLGFGLVSGQPAGRKRGTPECYTWPPPEEGSAGLGEPATCT